MSFKRKCNGSGSKPVTLTSSLNGSYSLSHWFVYIMWSVGQSSLKWTSRWYDKLDQTAYNSQRKRRKPPSRLKCKIWSKLTGRNGLGIFTHKIKFDILYRLLIKKKTHLSLFIIRCISGSDNSLWHSLNKYKCNRKKGKRKCKIYLHNII